MKRRDFLKTILLAATAPAFVKADNLMGLYVPKIWLPYDVYVDGSLDIPEHLRDGKSWKTAFSSYGNAVISGASGDVIISSRHTEFYEPQAWSVKDSPALVDIRQLINTIIK